MTPVEQAQRLQFFFDTEDSSFSDDFGINEALFSEEFDVSETDQQSEADMRAATSDTIWRNLYPALHSLACYLVRTSPLPYWRGQEDDMADDIAQETVRRVIERAQKAERGETPPIQSLKQMANTVAYNYYRDLKRHDYRLSRLDATDANPHGTRFYPADVRSDEYLLDLVAEKVDQDHLFDELADEIDRFPAKQKQAILIDLANRMYFDDMPTPLQQSFLAAGIELRQYRQPLPEDQRERGRHISLCSQAYKRAAQLAYYATGDSSTEQTSASETNHVSTSDPKERTEINMIPSMRSPSQSIQIEDIADPSTKTNTSEDVVTQNSNADFWISTLSEPYKTSLHMRMNEKKTYQEIANYMHLPTGTVKSHISRGRKILQKRMETNKVDEQATKREIEEAPLSIEHVLARKQVPERYRTALQLHYVEKLTYGAIASRLQIPIGTVKSYISRGKKLVFQYSGGN